MSTTLRNRITYANVMSTLAVFIALGGGAWAVTGRQTAASGKQIPAIGGAVRHPSGQHAAGFSTSPGNDRIDACVNNRTGAARIVSGRCASNEHRVSWVSFNGHFQSNKNNASIDITDSGIVLSQNTPGLATQTIKLTPGSMDVHADNIHLTTVKRLALNAGKDMTTQVTGDRTTTVDGNETTTIHRSRTTTVDKNETTTIHQNESRTVDQNQTVNVGINRAVTVGGASEDTIGGLMAQSVGGGLATSVGGNETTTINGNSTTSAIGGTLDTTAATIKNNADLIQNASDGSLINSAATSLVNSAGTSLTNHAIGNLTNSAGAGLTNQAGNTLTDKASKNLLVKAGNDLTVTATLQAILSAPTTHLGCSGGFGAARLGDSVNTASNPGSISGASTSVFVC